MQIQLHGGLVVTVTRAEGEALTQIVQKTRAAIDAFQRGAPLDQQLRLQAEFIVLMLPYVTGADAVQLAEALSIHKRNTLHLFAAVTGTSLDATYPPTETA